MNESRVSGNEFMDPKIEELTLTARTPVTAPGVAHIHCSFLMGV
jgi:hypothetical protein